MNTHFARSLSRLAADAMLLPVFGKAVIDADWRSSLKERMVLDGPLVSRECALLPEREAMWMHAASVGEVGGIFPLIDGLEKKFPRRDIVVSTTSLTGRRSVLAAGVSKCSFLLPLDHPVFVRRAIERIRPEAFFLFETEIWPNLLFELARANTKAYIVNARISDYTFSRYRLFRPVMKSLFSGVSRIFAQTRKDAERFVDLGAARDRVVVAGSTKCDRTFEVFSEEELGAYRKNLGLSESAPCFVAGSVRPGEDEVVIRAFVEARRDVSNLQMIVAPRHPECFDSVAEHLRSSNLDFNRRSVGVCSGEKPVCLLDTLGELSRAYALATVSFVGGSLRDFGGHNPLEPAAYCCPVIVGPYTSNCRDAVRGLRDAGALAEVGDEMELARAISDLCRNREKRGRMGAAARSYWNEGRGATKRILSEI